MNYEYIILYLICNLFATYVLFKFISEFLDKPLTSLSITVAAYIFYYVVTSFLYLTIEIPIVMLVSNLICIFLITLNYKASWKTKTLITLFVYTILVAIETIVVLFTGYVHFSFMEQSDFHSLWATIVIQMCSYILVLFIGNLKKDKSQMAVPNMYALAIFFIPSATLFLVLSLLSSHLGQMMIIIGVSLLLTLTVACFSLYDELSRLFELNIERLQLKQQALYLNNQIELMATATKKIRAVKHDFNNHIIALDSLFEQDDREKILEYLHDLKQSVSARGEYSQSGVTILDSILNYKISDAVFFGINVELDIIIPSTLPVKDYDMLIILGNLLDNAIEACQSLENGDRFINIQIKYNKNCLLIRIINNYKTENLKPSLLTTKLDKDNHGIGLEQVRKTVDKHDGNFEINICPDAFEATVLLYVNQ